MADITIQMSRSANQPWGFRLQGGVDFASPLTVLRVNIGSVAETAGLKAGDTILKVNQTELHQLRHQEALDVITKAGDHFQFTISRAAVWKPLVTPLGEPLPIPSGEKLLTKTSLALRQEESLKIGSAHNAKAAPFGAPRNDAKLCNKQFNSPMGLYSEENIAETLSSQAEVLAQGVLGVNFMKNEKAYDSTKSAVFKMLQEIGNEPDDPEPEAEVEYDPVQAAPMQRRAAPVAAPAPIVPSVQPVQQLSPVKAPQQVPKPSISFKEPVSEVVAPVAAPPRPVGVRSVAAPITKAPSKEPLPTADNPRCGECDRLIVGVFVRLKEKNLHVECFKCATCGTSLKNVGYYKINNKLYCDIHARQVASHHPPAPDLAPVTVNPGAPVPKHAMTTEVAAQQLGASIAALSSAKPAGGIRIFPPTATSAPQPFSRISMNSF